MADYILEEQNFMHPPCPLSLQAHKHIYITNGVSTQLQNSKETILYNLYRIMIRDLLWEAHTAHLAIYYCC